LTHCLTVANQWKSINCKQSTRWQHLSRLKASAFFSLQKNSFIKRNNLYSGLVTPSSGWWSPIALLTVGRMAGSHLIRTNACQPNVGRHDAQHDDIQHNYRKCRVSSCCVAFLLLHRMSWCSNAFGQMVFRQKDEEPKFLTFFFSIILITQKFKFPLFFWKKSIKKFILKTFFYLFFYIKKSSINVFLHFLPTFAIFISNHFHH
jgi:hypothetical protein